MNKKQPNPMEGVVRRPARRSAESPKRPAAKPPVNNKPEPVFVDAVTPSTSQPNQADIESIKAAGLESKMSLSLDNEDPTIDDTGSFKSRRRARKLKREQKNSTRSKFNLRSRKVGIVAGIIVLLIIGFLAFRGWMALQRIIVDRDGGGSPALNGGELKGEGDGRINIMLLGIGGEGHDGGNLADTIIIASIDPFAKEVAMLSIPRDMYADIPGYYGTKINAAHAYGEDEQEGGGPELMKKTLEQTLDIPIHYFMRVDFTGFVKAIDTVGGIDLYVPEAVYDTHFSGDSGYIVDVDEGWQYFNGSDALYYARSRYTSAGGDFDRNNRQRAIMIAMKDKVFSIGTFGNPNKIRELAESAGNHVRTDLQLDELRRLYEIMNEIPSDKIASYGLNNEEDNYLVSGNIDGASVLMPKDGDFTEIRRFVRELFVDGFIRSEAAQVDVYDGSGAGASVAKVDELKSYGYQIGVVADNDTVIPQTVIYDRSNGADPYTKRYLEQRFGVTMVSGDQLPSSIQTEAAFVIILGSNAQEQG